MILLISFLKGYPEILMHFNSILNTCVANGVPADCVTDVRSEVDLKKYLQQGRVDLVYIIAHTSEQHGIQQTGKSIPLKKLASCFPSNKNLLPEILFMNTCFGKQHYLDSLQKAGIKEIITTDEYIALNDALHYGELFIKELIHGQKKATSIVDSLNKKFEGYGEFSTFANINT